MKNNLKIGLVAILVLAMALAVAGCTSNNSASNGGASQQALSISAVQEPTPANVTAYYGGNIVAVNVTVNNSNAGTLKISTDNFYLTDSGGSVSQPIGQTVSWVTHSGEIGWHDVIYVKIKSGTTPSSLEYSDGTYDVSCTVS